MSMIAVVAAGQASVPAPGWTATSTDADTSPSSAAPRVAADGERLDLRTRSSRTLQRDGLLHTEFVAGSLHYEAKPGTWEPIDTSFVADGTGWRTAANDTVVRAHGVAAQGVRIERSGMFVEFAPQDIDAEARVSGNSMSYADESRGITVRYEAGPDALKEDVVLRDRASAGPIAFDVATSAGLDLRRSGQRVDVVDGRGNAVFTFATPFMDDAAGAHSDAVGVHLTRTAGGWSFTLDPDKGWLDDPARVWPVVIDPYAIYSPNTDCYISSSVPTTAQCTQTTFKVGSDGTNKHRALLKFDAVSDGSVIPQDAMVLDAGFSLTQTASTTLAGVTVGVHQVTKPWTAGVTWNTTDGTTAWTTAGGDFASTASDSAGIGWNNQRWELYPRTLMEGWVDGTIPNHGMMLKADEAVNNVMTFAASEHATSGDRPSLYVKWQRRYGLQSPMRFDDYKLDDRSTLHVNLANGNGVLEASDLNVAGTGTSFGYSRYHNSMDSGESELGQGWVGSGGVDLDVFHFGARAVEFNGASETTYLFPQTGASTFGTPVGLNASLEKDVDGAGTYRITYNDSKHKLVFKTFAASELVLWKQIDRNNNTITYNYDLNGEWDSVTDTQGRTFTVTHNGSGNISTITDNASRTWTYGYDNASPPRLTRYTNPEGHHFDYTYTGSRITRIRNVTDDRQTKIAYDGIGRVTSVTRVSDNGADTGPTTSYAYGVNTLTKNQSSVETDTTGWNVGSALSIARSTAQAADGIASLEATSSGTSMQVWTDHAAVPAKPDKTYTATLSTRALTTGAPASVGIRWMNSSGTLISETEGTATTNTTTGWTTHTATGRAPANTAYVSVKAKFTGVVSTAKHYVDKAGVVVGRSITWSTGTTANLSPSCAGLFVNRVTEPRGNATLNCHDERDRVQATVDALNHVRSAAYNNNDDITTFTGDTTTAAHALNYDSNRALTSIVAPASATGQTGATTSLHYPGSGLVHQPDSRTDPQGNCRAFTYDTPGNLVSVYDGLTPNGSGHCAGMTGTNHHKNNYNADGTLDWVQAPGGDCTAVGKPRCTDYTYTYAAAVPGPPVLQQLVIDEPATAAVGDVELGNETVEFDTSTRPIKVTDGRGAITRTSYDKLDRVTQVLSDNATTCSSATTCTTYTYDAAGNVTNRSDNAGVIAFTYDRLNRQTQRSAYHQVVASDAPIAHWPLNETTGTTAADLAGANTGTYTNGPTLGATGALSGNGDTAASFDGVDDSVNIADTSALRLNGSFTIEFWAKLDTFANTWPGVVQKGNSGTADGYLVWYTSDGKLVFKRNNVERATTTGQLTTSYKHFAVTYDGSTVRWYVNGVLDTSFAQTYPTNAGTAQLRLGRGDHAGDQTMDEVAIYGAALSADQLLDHYRAGNTPTAYGWDAANNLTSLADLGVTTTYQYDTVNNLCWLLVGTSADTCATTPSGAVTFGYDNDGRRTTTTYPTSPTATTMTAEYLPDGSLKTISAATGATTHYHLAYAYAIGTKDAMLRHTVSDQAGTVLARYGYDASNRLCWTKTSAGTGTCAAPPSGADRFVYDDAGNRTSQTVGGVTTSFTYNEANQLVGGTPTTPVYDAAGNETTGPDGRTAQYNAKGQTTSITPSGGSAIAMSYVDLDSTSRLRAASTAFSSTPLGISAVRNGGTTTHYIRDDNGTLVAQKTPTATNYYLFDGLGSVRNLLSSAGATNAAYTYDAWGKTTTSGTAAAGNPFRYAGGHHEKTLGNTELYKFGTRYYDPTYGRWTQRDAIAGRITEPGTVNRYAYAGSDPVNHTDPSGYSWSEWVAQGASTVLASAVVVGVCTFTAGVGCVAAVAFAYVATSTVSYAVRTPDGSETWDGWAKSLNPVNIIDEWTPW